MKKYFTSIAIFISTACFAQKDISGIIDSITNEGKILYRSEMASWYGTDVFLEKYSNKENIGGYVSYSEGLKNKCVFFAKSEKPLVIGTMTFDSTYDVNTVDVNLTERALTGLETDLYAIRKVALELAKTDSFFKWYKNSSLNFIPIITKGQKKVYILTGPKNNGVVIFGNDYLLNFDDANTIISKKRLHMNINIINYGNNKDDSVKTIGAAHTHLPSTGDFMTATDICTLMLYEKFAGWKQHIVVSEHYYNIWDCATNTLTAITKEVMDKINKQRDEKD